MMQASSAAAGTPGRAACDPTRTTPPQPCRHLPRRVCTAPIKRACISPGTVRVRTGPELQPEQARTVNDVLGDQAFMLTAASCDGIPVSPEMRQPDGSLRYRRATRRRPCGSRAGAACADAPPFSSQRLGVKPDAVARAERIREGSPGLGAGRQSRLLAERALDHGLPDRSRAFLKVASIDPSAVGPRRAHVFDRVSGDFMPRFLGFDDATIRCSSSRTCFRTRAGRPRGSRATSTSCSQRCARSPRRRSLACCRGSSTIPRRGGRRSRQIRRRSSAWGSPRKTGSSVPCRRCSMHPTPRGSTAIRSCTATCAATTCASASTVPSCSTGITQESATPHSTSPSGYRASCSKAGPSRGRSASTTLPRSSPASSQRRRDCLRPWVRRACAASNAPSGWRCRGRARCRSDLAAASAPSMTD